ncbi:alpha/beta hydrolase [Sphingomonas sabuli]|uniref:Alpha/beta hydrolase n=1 Tax=Sphingomonas sabuli TaxID=2764186 RepID=A0A7G9L141_9SPHN|nr:alpha/beta hydrolase [Sphingomonas sabuli]QNM82340.1 alpha/beta hydrolase [Sphingomonas sabuli]
MTTARRVPLSTGVTLNVAIDGPGDAPAVILLHGFPESHRTWRAVAPLLADRNRLVMPDQRGFGGSDRPDGVEAYRPDALVADMYALAETLGIDDFALVGHDWGGAVAWAAALRGDPRLTRLAIVNSPHPAVFQRSLIDNPAQRAASQYITAFRAERIEDYIRHQGFGWFFDKSFADHVDLSIVPAAERQRYIDDWSRPGALTAMLNWYRASPMIVPLPGEAAATPEWAAAFTRTVDVPTLVIWGMRDPALLPAQLVGLEELVQDLQIERIEDAGHFVPWEAPEAVAEALGTFLAGA